MKLAINKLFSAEAFFRVLMCVMAVSTVILWFGLRNVAHGFTSKISELTKQQQADSAASRKDVDKLKHQWSAFISEMKRETSVAEESARKANAQNNAACIASIHKAGRAAGVKWEGTSVPELADEIATGRNPTSGPFAKMKFQAKAPDDCARDVLSFLVLESDGSLKYVADGRGYSAR